MSDLLFFDPSQPISASSPWPVSDERALNFSPFMEDAQSLADPQAEFLDPQFLESLCQEILTTGELTHQAAPRQPSCPSASSRSPVVLCNNKMALDAKWAHLNDLTTVQLNRYFRINKVCEDDIRAIKDARRRAKSRVYSATARSNRKAAASPCSSTTTTTTATACNKSDSSSLRQELRNLQQELTFTRSQIATLTAKLAAKGIAINDNDNDEDDNEEIIDASS